MGKTHCTDTQLRFCIRFTSLSSCDGAQTQLEHLFAPKHVSSLDKNMFHEQSDAIHTFGDDYCTRV